MVKKITVLCCIILLTAAFSASAEELKIGVINIDKIITGSEAGQKAQKEIEGKAEEMKADLDKKKDEVTKMREDLQKQSEAGALSAQAKQDKQIELRREMRDLQDMYENYQRKIKTEEGTMLKPILDVLKDVIQDYGKKNNYYLIMESASGGLVYAADEADLTKIMIAELNKAWREKNK